MVSHKLHYNHLVQAIANSCLKISDGFFPWSELYTLVSPTVQFTYKQSFSK